jgi:hypothetical protein
MANRDPAKAKAYWAAYYQKHKESLNAQRVKHCADAHKANPEAARVKWRAAGKAYRSRRALKELAEIRAGVKHG